MPNLILSRIWIVLITSIVALARPGAVWADPSADLYKAHYLETASHDYQAARMIYERLAAADETPEAIRTDATRRAQRCRDELAAENLAALVPPDVMAYVEIRKPLALLPALARAVGLAGRDIHQVLAERPDADGTLPFHIPKQITLSPSLMEALESCGTIALAATGIREDGEPEGVVIWHHGNSGLLRGILETAMQFAPTAKKIAGLPTFKYEDKGIGVLTESLLIVAPNRADIEGVVARLGKGELASLATREDLRDVHERRAGATLFAYVDGASCLKQVRKHLLGSEQDQREFAEMNAFLDLEHLRWAAFAFGIRDKTIGAELTIRLADDHRNLVYDLLRLPSMSRRSLSFVPANAAAVAGLGLNPPAAPAAAREAAPADDGRVTGLDILRELFGNMHEASAFVVPGEGTTIRNGKGRRASSKTIPDIGLVIASNDVRRSAALWGRILSLPGRIMGGGGEPKTLDVQGVTARGYDLPEIGTVFMAEQDGCLLLTTTRAALRQSLRAHAGGKSVQNDAVMQAALKNVPADASLMVVVHGGRCAALAASQAPMSARMPLNIAGEALKDTVLWFGLGESPSQFSMRMGVSGLPDVNNLIQKFAPLANVTAQLTAPPREKRKVERRAPSRPKKGEDRDENAGDW